MNELVEKYFREELDASERLRLLKTIESDPELKEQFIEYKNMFGLLAFSNYSGDEEESKKGYSRFTGKLKRRKIYRIALQITSSAAAAAILIAATYWITVHNMDKQILPEQMNTVYVPHGQHIQITLQDGTKVWLNANTTLTYPTAFLKDERRVTIEGEAYFDVAKDAQKPFLVSAQGIEIKALGTQFNVYSYPDEHFVQTSLIEGGIKVWFRNAESSAITLKPNEQITIQDNKMEVKPIPHLDYYWWRRGIYTFHNEPLANVLKKLELYYDVQIIVKDPSINEWTYTGKFRHRDGINEILHLIQKLHRFTIEKDEDNNIITLK
ncbi:anti-sigma factor [Bacteroidia bacterium]|nr:anti-sigma factor [Bacteroidia bacterium]